MICCLWLKSVHSHLDILYNKSLSPIYSQGYRNLTAHALTYGVHLHVTYGDRNILHPKKLLVLFFLFRPIVFWLYIIRDCVLIWLWLFGLFGVTATKNLFYLLLGFFRNTQKSFYVKLLYFTWWFSTGLFVTFPCWLHLFTQTGYYTPIPLLESEA